MVNDRTKLVFRVCEKVGNPFLVAVVLSKRAIQLQEANDSLLLADAITAALREMDEKGLEHLIGSRELESAAAER
jgi:DNA-directed RNA polymerase subunit K/omega